MPSCSMACHPQLRLPARRPDRPAAGSGAFTLHCRRFTARRTISNAAYRYAPPAVNQSYSRDGLNRYTAVGGTSYAYDARQNLTSDGALTYAYDLENRLTSVTGTPGLTLSYDPLGRLRQVTTGGVTTTWLWDGDRLVAEYDNAGVLSARYAHGPGPDEPLTDWLKTTSAGRLWFHQDHQNTTIAMTDGAGAMSGSAYTYDAYGQPAGGTYSGPRFRFTGQTSLPGAPPLWHYKARAYAPGIGRFLQTDPIGYEDSLNLYGYVGNDPVNATDPTGMVACCDIRAIFRDAWDTIRGESAQQVHDRGGTGEELSQAIWEDGVRRRAGESVIAATVVLGAAVAVPVGSVVLAEGGVSGTATTVAGSSGSARASQVHSILDPIAQARRTTAVVETSTGRQFVASSRSTLSPAQRAALRSSETAARGQGHAEVTAVRAAQQAGETPVSVVATRAVCPACQALLRGWRVRF